MGNKNLTLTLKKGIFRRSEEKRVTQKDDIFIQKHIPVIYFFFRSPEIYKSFFYYITPSPSNRHLCQHQMYLCGSASSPPSPSHYGHRPKLNPLLAIHSLSKSSIQYPIDRDFKRTNCFRDLLMYNFPSRHNRQSIRDHFSSEYQKITSDNVPLIAFDKLAQDFVLSFVKVIVLF